MTPTVLGLHHLTAVCGEVADNVAFYCDNLGLRLVKQTVNFDDPWTYHLYYGDRVGSPGSLLTFFPYPGVPGRPGAGQVTAAIYPVAPGGLERWQQRWGEQGLSWVLEPRGSGQALLFTDRHGLQLELEETPEWEEEPEHAWGRLAGAVLTLRELQPTLELLELFGYRVVSRGDDRVRLRSAEGNDVLELRRDTHGQGRPGVGTFHHLALRVPDDRAQEAWRARLQALGFRVSPLTDRTYFRSLYFRGPEGVLYELATDPPGMLIDESEETLGERLCLPPQVEPQRLRLQQHLPPLRPSSSFRP